jgi:hypothetical protein
MKKKSIVIAVITALLLIATMFMDIMIVGQFCNLNNTMMMLFIKIQNILYIALAFSVVATVKALKP